MDEEFGAAPLGTLFVNPLIDFELKVLWNIIVFSTKSDQRIFFEGSNNFEGNLEVGFLAPWT